MGKSICRSGSGLGMVIGVRHSPGLPGRSRVEPGSQCMAQPPDPQLPWLWLSWRWVHPRGSPSRDCMSRAERKWICGDHGQRVWVTPREAGRGHKDVLVALGALTRNLSFCGAISMPQQSERERSSHKDSS